jgi:hypothetical protein
VKWYKHDSNANSDAKLRRVRLKYGMEGYGLYWYCLELIAQNVEKDNLSFELEHDAEIIAADTGIHFERVQEMMVYMVDLGLFEESNGAITCLKLARRCDEYTSKVINQLGSVPTDSRQSRDKLRINRTEEKRTEEIKTDSLPSVGKARKRAARLPEDFNLTDERRAVAEAEKVPAERTFAKFCDHWLAASGQSSRKLDWDAAWRNWCRTEADRSRGSSRPAPKLSYSEQLAADMKAKGMM